MYFDSYPCVTSRRDSIDAIVISKYMLSCILLLGILGSTYSKMCVNATYRVSSCPNLNTCSIKESIISTK